MVKVKNPDYVVDRIAVYGNAGVGRFFYDFYDVFAAVFNIDGDEVDSRSHYLLYRRIVELKSGLEPFALVLIDDAFFLYGINYG